MERTEKLALKLGATEAFITTDEKTRFYLTKFAATDGTLLVTAKESYLFVDFRYIEAAEKEARGCKIIMPKGRTSDEIKKIIAESGIKRFGFEENKLTVASLNALKTVYGDIEFFEMGNEITKLCEFKDETEMECVRQAQNITDKAFSEILGIINPDMTETEVALELEYRMKKLGASGTSFETICVSGTNSSRPHGVPCNEKLQKGFLTMDFGCIYNGYCSDMTRTVVIGKADGEMKKVYDTVLKAQLSAIEAVREGMTGAELDKVARDVINGAGYEGCFGHGLGHGVGIYIHEEPRVAPAGAKQLVKGHIFTVEPGIYLKGKYGVRIEDMVQMTENGPVDITHSPKNLIEIG